MSVLVQTTAFPSSPFRLASLSTLSAQAWFFPIVHWDRGKIFVSCPCLFVFHYIKRTSDFRGYQINWTYYIASYGSWMGRNRFFTAIYFIKDKTHSAFVWFLVKKICHKALKANKENQTEMFIQTFGGN